MRTWVQSRARRGFTYTDLIVVLILLVLAISFLLPSLSQPRERANRVKCASNLRQIGQAMLLYAGDSGTYPRLRYDPKQPCPTDAPTPGSGCSTTRPFGPGAPRVNDVTGAIFLLVRNCDLSTEVFVCPSSMQEKDTMNDTVAEYRSNFTDPQKNLSYSIANPYPGKLASDRGYKWSTKVSAEWAIAADRNDGKLDYSAERSSPEKVQRAMNSGNHEGDGQNVLFNDGHVDWFRTAWAGHNGDNVYTAARTQEIPAGSGNFTQLTDPASIPGLWDPQYDMDTVLLPVFPATARPFSDAALWGFILFGLALAVVIIIALTMRKRRSRALATAAAIATAATTPPPLPAIAPDRSAKWFYHAAGQTVGPCTFDQLAELAHRRMFTASDMVCTETNQQWIPAGKVKGLFPEQAT